MKQFIQFAFFCAAFLIVGQSCQTGESTGTVSAVPASEETISTDDTGLTDDITEDTVSLTTGDLAQLPEYGVNEEAVVGDIVHRVTEVEVLSKIPIEYTLEEWSLIAKSLPAGTGMQWVHLQGMVRNNSSQKQTIDSTNIYMIDEDGAEYTVSTDTTIYIPEGKLPVAIDVDPGERESWEAYFLVPENANGVKLLVNDLTFLPEDEALIDLGLVEPADASKK